MEAAPKKGRGRPAGSTKAAKAAKGPTQKRKRKTKKTENAVKKPTSAYIYFVAHYRQELKKKGEPTNKVQEIAKKCGSLWKEMSDEDKKPFHEKAAEDKARYQKLRAEEDLAKGKDPNKPKRPPTAYFIFLAKFREDIKKNPIPEGTKVPSLAGEKWKEMSDSDKAPYVTQAEKEREKYQQEMETYKKTHPAEPKAARKSAPKKRKPEPEEEEDEEEEEEDDDDDEDEEDEDDDDSDE